MSKEEDILRNGSGYVDPTFYKAVKNKEKSETRYPDLELARLHKLLNLIFDLCELSDFHVEERIVLKDKRTGRIYR